LEFKMPMYTGGEIVSKYLIKEGVKLDL